MTWDFRKREDRPSSVKQSLGWLAVLVAKLLENRSDPGMREIKHVSQHPLGNPMLVGDKDHQIPAKLPALAGTRPLFGLIRHR